MLTFVEIFPLIQTNAIFIYQHALGFQQTFFLFKIIQNQIYLQNS